MKVKFGTQLEDTVYEQLKVAAAKEKRPIGEIVQDALADYLQRQKRRPALKLGLQRLLESDPLNITSEQLRESMEADFYGQ
jgi:predicted transcriptional regulator